MSSTTIISNCLISIFQAQIRLFSSFDAFTLESLVDMLKCVANIENKASDVTQGMFLTKSMTVCDIGTEYSKLVFLKVINLKKLQVSPRLMLVNLSASQQFFSFSKIALFNLDCKHVKTLVKHFSN